MNISVILDYFKYFIAYSSTESENKYSFISQKNRFDSFGINDLLKFSYKDSKCSFSSNLIGDPDYYFKATKSLKAIQQQIDINVLATLYEIFFQSCFEKKNTDLLISGGVTGFERCGLFIARKLGIKTLCIWEGFFRPTTISFDPVGMNVESKFNSKLWSEIELHMPSRRFVEFYDYYTTSEERNPSKKNKLNDIQKGKFNFLHQLRNRYLDRNDIERIILPISQHLEARLSYFIGRYKYCGVNEINEPFIFFPLQTHTDSNIVINSQFFPFDKCVKFVQSSFQEIQKKIKCNLLIKEHPFDVLRKRYSKVEVPRIKWLDPSVSIQEILTHKMCLGSIVVNSTAGLESLINNKPVLTLGNSIYNREQLTLSITNQSNEELNQKLLLLIEQKVNSKNVEKFCSCLFDTMQFEGSLDQEPDLSERLKFERIFNRIVVQ